MKHVRSNRGPVELLPTRTTLGVCAEGWTLMIMLTKIKTCEYLLVPHAVFCASTCGFPHFSVFMYTASPPSEQSMALQGHEFGRV